jgi:hypothetical protein
VHLLSLSNRAIRKVVEEGETSVILNKEKEGRIKRKKD